LFNNLIFDLKFQSKHQSWIQIIYEKTVKTVILFEISRLKSNKKNMIFLESNGPNVKNSPCGASLKKIFLAENFPQVGNWCTGS
jgi:hypothetical protein